MSRTYKCTKGSSKKIKPEHEHWLMFNFDDERRESIDYEDGLDSERARDFRLGKRNKRPAKGFRKIHEAQERMRAKQYLFNCIKDEDFWYDNVESLERKGMAWWWY